ncbi:MAG: pyridoxal-phosphate dependent enzyme [bacterium]
MKNIESLENAIRRCRERNIIIPTYEQMRDPEKILDGIKKELKSIGLWDLHSRNLFRITWKNEPIAFGGGFGGVNHMEIPKEISGVRARIVVLLGKFFPTGSHKVGATFGPLVEKLVRGEFDPTRQKALWPSTGNYCRGGAYNSYLLGCPSISVLPEGMSRERFGWLKKLGSEIHATPGSESNVKEVYDKTKELKSKRFDEIVVLNQFEEFGNAVWHYAVTGPAMEEVYQNLKQGDQRFAGIFLTQGSAGTLACADYIREIHPQVKVCAGEALQCPTLLFNGYGSHRIEGIGDKHVPWIHNIKNMDLVAGIDDEHCMRLVRLFNEPVGKALLKKKGVPSDVVDRLDLFGISSIANIIGAIKLAKYFEMTERDFIFTVSTDSMELYQSRIEEIRKEKGVYSEIDASMDFEACLMEQSVDWIIELSYWDKRRLHNLKYFTWVEQQGKTVEELDAQWYDENYWKNRLNSYKQWDRLIEEFNQKTGLIKQYR